MWMIDWLDKNPQLFNEECALKFFLHNSPWGTVSCLFCSVWGLLKIGRQAHLTFKQTIILAGLLKRILVLNLINYFSVSGASKQKNNL